MQSFFIIYRFPFPDVSHDLLVKPLNGPARLIKDGKQQTSRVVLLDLLLSIVWLLLFVIFRRRE
jgi:hypothetical protein